ncbi:MAG: DUF427 domain-containing protein [Pseudomonadota bacterium]
MANPAPGFAKHPNHKILLDTGPDAVTVRHGDTLIAMTTTAVLLREDGYPTRAYIPRGDVTATLAKTDKTTHCPFKGDTVYFNVVADGTEVGNGAWSYEAPYDEMADIKDHVAFDDRFEITIG